MTATGAYELTRNNHTVYVRSDAGKGSGFSVGDYKDVRVIILDEIGYTP